MDVGRTSSWERIVWWESSIGRCPRRFTRRITVKRFFTPVLNKDCPVDREAHDRHFKLTPCMQRGRRH